jgi:inhibitor of KinA
MLRDFIHELTPGDKGGEGQRRHVLPVCYDGPDFRAATQWLSLDPGVLIELHTGQDYLVYQLGFRPGFAFLGDTPAALEIARHASPRARVPAGSVGLAGRQTGVYPTASPGGWQLIGRCPLPLVRAGTNPTLLRAGDLVRFRPVTPAEFIHLQNHPPPWPER